MADGFEDTDTPEQAEPGIKDDSLGNPPDTGRAEPLFKANTPTENRNSGSVHSDDAVEEPNDNHVTPLVIPDGDIDTAAQDHATPGAESLPADQGSSDPPVAAKTGNTTKQQSPDDLAEPVATTQNTGAASPKADETSGASATDPCPKALNCQHCQHFEIEQRLNTFETRNKRLMEALGLPDVYDLESKSSKDPASDNRIPPVPEPNFITVQDYKKRNADSDFSLGKRHYAFDVVVTDTKTKDLDLTSVSVESERDKSADVSLDRAQIRLIQVNSASLQAVFHQLGDSAPRKPVKPLLIFSPFKSLCYRSELLQDQLNKLKDPMQSVPTSSRSGGAVVKDAEPENSTATHEETLRQATIDDLSCLMEFYRQHIEPPWQHLRQGQVESVSFADLSSLFQPGDEVFEHGSSQRVWKVTRVTGGRPTVQHLFEGEDINGDSPSDKEQANITAQDLTLGSTQSTEKEPSPNGLTSAKETTSSDVADKWTTFHIDGYYIDYDGSKFGPVPKQASIAFFPGRMNVTALAVHPLRLVSDVTKKCQARKDEGRRLVRCCEDKTRLYYYASSTLNESPGGKSLRQNWRASPDDTDHVSRAPVRVIKSSDIEERVVVDFLKTFQYNPDWAPAFGPGSHAKYDNRDMGTESGIWNRVVKDFFASPSMSQAARQLLDYYDKKQSEDFTKQDHWLKQLSERDNKGGRSPRDDETLLLPDRVFGFVLRTRTWTCFSIERLLEIDDDRTQGWDELQIPEDHKKSLLSLFDHHRMKAKIPRPGKWDFDFIEGKGNGLIVLLHGVPGVGKTSTAESLASKYKRPLLPITCGNLGIDAYGVEQALTENFELAEAWDAIVLLDEADVFLARRRTEDLQRNALVSIFLRTLEYYNGILFLTTNRTGDFDDAFRSRIHASLFYDDLNEESTKAIWQSNLNRLGRQVKLINPSFVVEHGGTEIVEFATRHFQCLVRNKRQPWNGRQIRNAFHTAVALAEFDGKTDFKPPVLQWGHFKSTAMASERFESYLKITLGGSERELASNEKLRAPNPMDPSTGEFRFPRSQQGLKEELKQFRQELERLSPFATGVSKDVDPRNASSNQFQSQAGSPTSPPPQGPTPMPSMPSHMHPYPPGTMATAHTPNFQQQPVYYPYANPGVPQHSAQPYLSGQPHMQYPQPHMGAPTAGYHQAQYPQPGYYGQPPMGPPPPNSADFS